MTEQQVIHRTAQFIKQRFAGEGSGHDWWHLFRVWQLAKQIAETEPEANLFVVELGALLHDVADWKFTGGDDSQGPKVARRWLAELAVDDKTIDAVCHIIADTSFKGAKVTEAKLSLEAKIVQDADRLDAIGAIGVARAFTYGGYAKQPMHDPNVKHVFHDSFEAYKNKKTTTINHFYEKLLLLKERMNTQKGLELAEKRHHIMEQFLGEFLTEWQEAARVYETLLLDH